LEIVKWKPSLEQPTYRMPHWIEINRAPVLTLWAAVVAIVVLLADFTVLVSMPAGDCRKAATSAIWKAMWLANEVGDGTTLRIFLPRPILVLKAATAWLPKIRKDFKKLTN
jgi:uncharacterized membrane protein YdfJ with MMPL/SSD domain